MLLLLRELSLGAWKFNAALLCFLASFCANKNIVTCAFANHNLEIQPRDKLVYCRIRHRAILQRGHTYQMAVPAGNLPLCTHRYLMMVSYLGSKYNGSQRLTGRDEECTQNTVQEALEWSLEKFMPKKRCRITTSSRTDRGVHALMSCYTLPLMDFDTPTERIRKSLNYHLIKNRHDITWVIDESPNLRPLQSILTPVYPHSVNDVVLVPAEFHPRKCAVGREYIYRIAVFDDPKFSHMCKKHHPQDILHLLPITEIYRLLPLTSFNFDKAREVVDLFQGEHDFASFVIRQENVPDTTRDMSISLTRLEPSAFHHEIPHPYSLYQLHFKSKSFLYNQVSILSLGSFPSAEIEKHTPLTVKNFPPTRSEEWLELSWHTRAMIRSNWNESSPCSRNQTVKIGPRIWW